MYRIAPHTKSAPVMYDFRNSLRRYAGSESSSPTPAIGGHATRMLDPLLNWRLRTPFYYGWLILGMSSMATFAASGVSQVVLGGIQVYISDDTGWDPSTLSYAATAGTWLSGLIAPVIGRMADRYGPRWLMSSGLLVAGVCFLLLAGVSAVWQFYAAYVIARAVSNPVLIGLVPRTAAVNFFRRRRNIALAMVSTFRPIAGAINIQLFALITLSQSWREGFRYLGFFSLALIIPVILLMRRRPRRHRPTARRGGKCVAIPTLSRRQRERSRASFVGGELDREGSGEDESLLADCRDGLRGDAGLEQRGLQHGAVPGGGRRAQRRRGGRGAQLRHGAVHCQRGVGECCRTNSRRAAA